MRRVAEIFLFDTCSHKCGYCHFAETGKVLDNSQLKPYTDPAFVDVIVEFFNKRTTEIDNWVLTLTGGEPLLMPNLAQLARGLASRGNRLAFYTALLVGENHPGFRLLLDEGAAWTDFLMVSFHAEAERDEKGYFAKIARLKAAGHSVIVRFVGHPDRLHRLDELSAMCRDIDVAFHPTPLFSPAYPASYSAQERKLLEQHAVSLSQIIQLDGGVDTETSRCSAGSSLIFIDIRTGNIVPCASTSSPILGNIFEDSLKFMPESIVCPSKGIACVCDTHFQHSVVTGADDRPYFEAELQGFVEPIDADALRSELQANQIRMSKQTALMGQTDTSQFAALETSFVKEQYKANKSYFENGYAERHHPAFRSRQGFSS